MITGHGLQPLDAVMTRFGLTNQSLVSASTQQLTFKMIQKGRKGRRLTPNVQKKILAAVRAAIALTAPDDPAAASLTLKELFNYRR